MRKLSSILILAALMTVVIVGCARRAADAEHGLCLFQATVTENSGTYTITFQDWQDPNYPVISQHAGTRRVVSPKQVIGAVPSDGKTINVLIVYKNATLDAQEFRNVECLELGSAWL